MRLRTKTAHHDRYDVAPKRSVPLPFSAISGVRETIGFLDFRCIALYLVWPELLQKISY